MAPRETGRSGYKAKLIKKLEEMFPGCLIARNDPKDTHQGIPDLTIFYNDRWAMLETKAAPKSARQPNQGHWVEHYNNLSFASFIYPEIEEEVLHALQRSLAPSARARNSQRQH